MHCAACPTGIGLWTVGDPLPRAECARTVHQVLTFNINLSFPLFSLKADSSVWQLSFQNDAFLGILTREKDNAYPPFEKDHGCIKVDHNPIFYLYFRQKSNNLGQNESS